MNEYLGRCRCGRIEVRLRSARAPHQFQPRSDAATCSFCRAHDGVWISDPDGALEIGAADATVVRRSGSGQVAFHFCAGCDELVYATFEGVGVVRVGLFEAIRDATPPAVATHFDGEPLAAGQARRLANWTPVTSREPRPLEFWFDYASTYSYLAAARIESLAADRGVAVVWRPFLLGPIFEQRGWHTSPFNLDPAKGRYMWRDVARIAATRDLRFRRPTEFPRNSTLAARVALVAAAEGWVAPYSRAVFAANFARDQDIADPAVIDAILAALGHPAAEVRDMAHSAAFKPMLRAQTVRAVELGIFGAPTFTLGDELFWGDDRLETALAFAVETR